MLNWGELEGPPKVVGLGEVLWDLLPEGKHLGGAPTNFTFHATQLGACGIVVSSIGPDDLGQQIIRRFIELGLPTDYLQQNEHSTGTVTVTTDMDGKPSYVIHSGVAWDFLIFTEDVSTLAKRADAVCFGSLAQRSSITRQSIQAFLKTTRRDCLRVLDVNLRQQFYDVEIIDRSLALSDVLKLSDEELPIIAQLLQTPADELLAVSEIIKRYSLRMVALTRGSKGSSLYTKHRVSHSSGYPTTRIVDTVGAGDSFTAALVMGLLSFADLDRVHDQASRLASFICSQQGATPPIPVSFLESLY